VDEKGRALVFVDGVVTDTKDAKVSVWDRGFLFGDAVFEALRFARGKPILWKEHYERLLQSAKGIRLELGFDEGWLLERTLSLIEQSGLDEGTIYMQITRGNVGFRSDTVLPEHPTVMIAVDGHTCLEERMYDEGVSAITFEDIRWRYAHLKTTNLLPRTLARLCARDAGAYEAIFVGKNREVYEGTATNVMLVKDGVLKTPSLSERLLSGATRGVLLKIAREIVDGVYEGTCTVDDLLSADEVMLCGTTTEVIGVVRLDGIKIGDGRPGKVTKMLHSLYRQKVLQASD